MRRSCPFEGLAKIYALTDNEDRPFYVGCTVQDLELRKSGHVYEAMKNDAWMNQFKNDKIRSLKFKIGVRILDSVPVKGKNKRAAQRMASKQEKYWIKKLLSEGFELCNRVHGNIKYVRGEKMRMISAA